MRNHLITSTQPNKNLSFATDGKSLTKQSILREQPTFNQEISVSRLQSKEKHIFSQKLAARKMIPSESK